MTNMSGDMAEETSVTGFFTLPKLGRDRQCLDPTMPQKWSGPDPGLKALAVKLSRCDGSDLVLCTVDGGLRAIVFLHVFL